MAASALTIQLDYTYDQANGGDFFGLHPGAKATLEAAAADLGAALGNGLVAVNTDVFNGTSGAASVTFNWSIDVTNPVTDATVTLNTFTLPANTVRVYVGMRPLLSNTLGTGGPGAGGFGISFSGSGASLQTATNNAQAASNAVMARGAGPVIGSLSGSIGTANYTLNYGALFGNLWFDSDSNNDGFVDDFATLDNYWNFSLALPTAGKNDFYSVALHELMHSIGFGASDTWDAKHSGTTWLGANAIAANGGSGLNLVSADGAHLASGFMSPRLSDGVMQEVAMDPSITVGTRKSLTQMDLAILRDLNYAAVPEPSTALLVATVLGLGLTSRRRSQRPALSGDRSCPRS